MERYVAFDVETPNRFAEGMCAIGIAVVERGQVVDKFYSLVNPESSFDWQCIQIHGITPEMAAEAPTFPELWPELRRYLSSGVLLAHNAGFDMSVLAKSLRRWGLPWQQQALYACTVQMGRACIPDAPNHKLNTLSDLLGIQLRHHDAGSDAEACARLFCHYLSKGLDPVRFYRMYDMVQCRACPKPAAPRGFCTPGGRR